MLLSGIFSSLNYDDLYIESCLTVTVFQGLRGDPCDTLGWQGSTCRGLISSLQKGKSRHSNTQIGVSGKRGLYESHGSSYFMESPYYALLHGRRQSKHIGGHLRDEKTAVKRSCTPLCGNVVVVGCCSCGKYPYRRGQRPVPALCVRGPPPVVQVNLVPGISCMAGYALRGLNDGQRARRHPRRVHTFSY